MTLLIAFLPTLVYFLPTLICACRNHRNGCAVLIVNLFLGWTLIGWVVALAWSLCNDPKPVVIQPVASIPVAIPVKPVAIPIKPVAIPVKPEADTRFWKDITESFFVTFSIKAERDLRSWFENIRPSSQEIIVYIGWGLAVAMCASVLLYITIFRNL